MFWLQGLRMIHETITIVGLLAILGYAIQARRTLHRRHTAYRTRADALLTRLQNLDLFNFGLENFLKLNRDFDANQRAWGEAPRRPWWRRDPIDGSVDDPNETANE